MKVEQPDVFYKADGSKPDWSKIGGRARFNGTSYANMLVWGLYLYTAPTPYDPATQNLGAFATVMQDDEQVGITREVVDKTQVELEAELTALKKENCDLLDQTALNLVAYEIQPAGMLMVERMMRYDPPNVMATEVNDWVVSVYAESQIRKAHCEAGTWPKEDDLFDFSSFGSKPHTIAELMAEYTGV